MWSSDKFSSKENILRINLAGSSVLGGAWVLYGYTEGGEKKPLRREDVAQGSFAIKHDFDPVSYGVYSGAVEFSVEFDGECQIDCFEITVPTKDKGISNAKMAKFVGDKVAIYDIDENEILVPYLPKKVLYIGNSLIAGMFNSYGMCATDAKHDYAYLVSQAILSRSPNATFRKLHGSDFEHCVSEEEYDKCNIIDVSYLAMAEDKREDFLKAMIARKEVAKVIQPISRKLQGYDAGEPAMHFEINQA